MSSASPFFFSPTNGGTMNGASRKAGDLSNGKERNGDKKLSTLENPFLNDSASGGFGASASSVSPSLRRNTPAALIRRSSFGSPDNDANAAPAAVTFAADRTIPAGSTSALSSALTIDTTGASTSLGLRQRRKPTTESTLPLPKASLSLAMTTPATTTTSTSLDHSFRDETAHNVPMSSLTSQVLPSNSLTLFSPSTSSPMATSESNWICIFGVSSKDHYDKVLRHFRQAIGPIASHRQGTANGYSTTPRRTHNNWMAVEFVNRQDAERALLQPTIQLEENVYCGVGRMQKQSTSTPEGSVSKKSSGIVGTLFSPSTLGSPGIPKKGLFANGSNGTTSTTMTKASNTRNDHRTNETMFDDDDYQYSIAGATPSPLLLEEKDILLEDEPDTGELSVVGKLCRKLVQWLLQQDGGSVQELS